MTKLNKVLEFKAVGQDDNEGRIKGYLNTWDIDLYGDQTQKGAFKNWIDKLNKEKKTIPLLIEHDTGRIAGAWDTASFKEDETGLYGEAVFNLETTEGREAYSNAKMLGSSWGLSIGFFTLDSEYKNGVRELLELDLFETSLVVVPANQQSGVTGVKSVREVEKGLRDLGFSRKQAKSIIHENKIEVGEEKNAELIADVFEMLAHMDAEKVKQVVDKCNEFLNELEAISPEEKSILDEIKSIQISFEAAGRRLDLLLMRDALAAVYPLIK